AKGHGSPRRTVSPSGAYPLLSPPFLGDRHMFRFLCRVLRLEAPSPARKTKESNILVEQLEDRALPSATRIRFLGPPVQKPPSPPVKLACHPKPVCKVHHKKCHKRHHHHKHHKHHERKHCSKHKEHKKCEHRNHKKCNFKHKEKKICHE